MRCNSVSFRAIGLKILAPLVCMSLILFNCANEGLLEEEAGSDDMSPVALAVTTAPIVNCSTCKYIVPENLNTIDAEKLGIKPGDKICLQASTQYGKSPLRFINIVGALNNPVVITNCGGTANVTVPGNLTYVVKFENCKYFRFTGGNTDGNYGIKMAGSSTIGVSIDKLSTEFEVDHVEVSNVGFAGIMAKTDPTCDVATNRGNFILRNAFIHHNYLHDTGGEGLYIGNSFYTNGVSTTCGTKYPHDLENVKIYSNVIKNTGWEGIQLGSATKGAAVYDNIVENYGTANISSQNNGIQIGEGTGGLCYNNYVKTGPGNGIIVLGLGDNTVYNNVIINAGASGIFCDDRTTTGTGFKFINNTIVNPKADGIRIYADKVGLVNLVMNNLIGNPGSFNSYEADNTPRTGENDSYIYLLSGNVNVIASSNFNTRNAELANYLNLGSFSSALVTHCQVKDKGTNPAIWGVSFDFKMTPRPAGGGYDIGAVEY